MRRPRLLLIASALAAALLAGLPASLPADADPEPVGDPLYVEASSLISKGRHAEALAPLEALVAKSPNDADAFNLLGYASRKLGRLEPALAFYLRALSLKPNHRGAHEYIGEAYLALGQLDKAKEHLAFLDDDCWLPCREYTALKKAVAEYEARHKR